MEQLKETKKLGFGLMRLPKKGISIDVEETSKMVDMFMEAGFTYYDTAYLYPGSEAAISKALVQRYPRESYTLATKLFAMSALTEKMAKKELDTSLERTGAEYIDYYLLHFLIEANFKKYERFHLWDFVKEEKAKGRIRHYGFSFHGGPELLDRLLTEHPDVDFVQLQLNYADWDHPIIRSRENYEVARRHNKPIVVMEPVKGGILANPPAKVRAIFDAVNPGASYASWAIRFVASLEGIHTVLSGMSNIAQMQDNLSYMENFQPLNEAEQEAIRKAQVIFHESKTIPCTACRYCTKGCPKGIPIPDIFAARNKQLGLGQIEEGRRDYAGFAVKADACILCKQCERSCPQQLKITDLLKDCAENLK